MRNVHIMFIYIYRERAQESRNTENTYDFFVQVLNFLLPLSLKVLRHKESESQSFYASFFICFPLHLLRHLPKASVSKRKATLLVRCLVSTILTFSKSPKSSARFRCVMSFALAIRRFSSGLSWYVQVTRPLCARARAWTPVLMLHLSNPCPVPKGSQPN